MKRKLSNREIDVMNILWDAKEPLTASGMTQIEKELSINTVQVVLKNLIKKSCIRVADIVYSGTVLSRAYEPVMTKADYFSSQVLEDRGLNKEVLAALLKSETDLKKIEALEEVLRVRRKELKGE